MIRALLARLLWPIVVRVGQALEPGADLLAAGEIVEEAER